MIIDLSEVKTIIVIIASLIGSLGVICAFVKKIIDGVVDKITQPILEKIEEQRKALVKQDENHCKDFLMSFLTDVENGMHKNQFDIARAHEVYAHYTNDLKLNSYIHKRWYKVMESEEERE